MKCHNLCQQGNEELIKTVLLCFFNFKQAQVYYTNVLKHKCGLNLATLQGNDYNDKYNSGCLHLFIPKSTVSHSHSVYFSSLHQLPLQTVNEVILQ